MEELAEVYSRSLFEVAQEQGALDDIREQLGQFADAVSEDRDLQVFFFSPYFSSQEKKDGISKAVEGANEYFVRFLEMLAERHRLPVIFRIHKSFEKLWEDENKVLPVTITSAIELDETTIKEIGDKIADQTGRKVEVETDVDPDVLGGLVMRVGDTVLDASIRMRLERLRKQVATAA
ncbi:MAG: F0F1 ATP synthase subunit delta [Thermoleophilaceae bacterium]|nr:F0F1 ATP synthase subunit delta [Thermoleophilaceae bacterium]